jgi:endonuclease/exonuclease/phosphatase (EEP) superfamily protein YafD
MKPITFIWFLLFILASLCLTYFPQNYIFMLAKSFNFQIMIGYALLAILLIFRRQWLIASSCFIAVMIIFVYINAQVKLLNLTITSNSPSHREDVREWAFATFNVLMPNSNYRETINSALYSNADLITFQEIDEKWARELESKLKTQYPYYKLVPQNDLWGIGVFSKHPLINLKVIHLIDKPCIAGELFPPLSGGAWRDRLFFLALHAESPETYSDYLNRDKQFKLLASLLDTVSKPKFILGDFNATPWDQAIINFKKQAFLKDSRKSLCPTFPTIFPPVIIPLDYIFYSSDVECVEFKTMGNGDSDHKGVMGKYIY